MIALQHAGFNLSLSDGVRLFDNLHLKFSDPLLPASQMVKPEMYLAADLTPQEMAQSARTGKPYEKGRKQMVVVVNNLDPSMSKQHPLEYLAATILAVADNVDEQIQKMSGPMYQRTLESLNDFRVEREKTVLDSFDYRNYLREHPLVMATSDDDINLQLQALGLATIPGGIIHLQMDFMMTEEQSLEFRGKVGIEESTFYKATFDDIMRLRERYPHLAKDAKKFLQPRLFNLQHRLDYAGYL